MFCDLVARQSEESSSPSLSHTVNRLHIDFSPLILQYTLVRSLVHFSSRRVNFNMYFTKCLGNTWQTLKVWLVWDIFVGVIRGKQLSLKPAVNWQFFWVGKLRGSYIFMSMLFHLLIKDFFLTTIDKKAVCTSFLHLKIKLRNQNNEFLEFIIAFGKI